jgi:golgi-specific brefeldin A-resistance guanine nucleotide exchange factor 1
MGRGLRHPRVDDAAAEHPLVTSLWALPYLDVVRSDEIDAFVTSASPTALHEVMALPGAVLREIVDTVAGCRLEVIADLQTPATRRRQR